MPAAVAVPLITTAIGTGASIFQSSVASSKAKQARKNIEDYQRQNLENPYASLQVSTLGADRKREDLARTMASYGSLAAMGGSRAVSALLPNLIAQQNAQEAEIVANLDQQEAQRQQLIAQGNSMVQQMTEQRENNDLLGMGNELSIYEQQNTQGQNNLMQGLIQGGASIATGVIGSPNKSTGVGSKTPLAGADIPLVGNGLPANVPTQAESIPLPNSIQTFNFQPTFGNKFFPRKTPNWALGLNGQYRGF